MRSFALWKSTEETLCVLIFIWEAEVPRWVETGLSTGLIKAKKPIKALIFIACTWEQTKNLITAPLVTWHEALSHNVKISIVSRAKRVNVQQVILLSNSNLEKNLRRKITLRDNELVREFAKRSTLTVKLWERDHSSYVVFSLRSRDNLNFNIARQSLMPSVDGAALRFLVCFQVHTMKIRAFVGKHKSSPPGCIRREFYTLRKIWSQLSK